MPVAQSDIEHLLRRTEFVARPERVSELTAAADIGAAVDNILAVPANPGSPGFTSGENWRRGEDITYFWFDRMAHDSPRPMQEKMAFFWHGHFCSEFGKVGSAVLMREQIDLWRHGALTNFRTLARTMSTQVAMLRYLDNNQNKQSSPNQNFARELMELFLLGVGNYTEADVEAATAAWTGHTDNWETDAYVWRADWHDNSNKSFLGRTINQAKSDTDQRNHGYETIEVILGDPAVNGGRVPAGAAVAPNRNRPTRDVAAEFVSRKLWTFFAGTTPPAAVIDAMRTSAIANGFEVRPWVRTMLTRPEFYTTEVKQGLVRSPVDLLVAYLYATGLRARDNAPLWLMEGTGQRPLFPPNVAGWKHNGYFVNAGAMAARTGVARSIGWRTMRGYWGGDGLIHLAGGTISRSEIEDTYRDQPEALVDRMLQLMRLSPTNESRQALYAFSRESNRWERNNLVSLIFLMPEMHVA
jgi:uncharacterized protein (DUF1800 family)